MVVCYKSDYSQDPMYGKDAALVTTDFRERPGADPESSLTGTLYEGYPVDASYVVASPSSWIFAGTGVGAGDVVPAPGRRRVRPGQPRLPGPAPDRGAVPFAAGLQWRQQLRRLGLLHHPGGAGVFNSGTMRWVEALYGDQPHGIGGATPGFVRRVTANVLRAFASGPAAHRYPAGDNLDAIREYSGDPVGAPGNLQ